MAVTRGHASHTLRGPVSTGMVSRAFPQRGVLMRAISFVIVAAVLAGGMITMDARESSAERPTRHSVNVLITCTGGQITVDVDPWTVVVQQGDSTDWTLRPQSTPDGIDVGPKRGGAWPYQANQVRGSKQAAARALEMRPNQPPGRRYKYNITGICVQAGRTDTIVIDPDIVIGE